MKKKTVEKKDNRTDKLIFVDAGIELKEKCKMAAKKDNRSLSKWCSLQLEEACQKAGV